MLQEQAVPEPLLAVLRQISPVLQRHQFYLAGGTALALRFGHRLSVDLDFFSVEPFMPSRIEAELKNLYPTLRTTSLTEGSICCILDGVKVEAFHYPSTLLSPVEVIDDLTLASLPDNAAMKLSALVNRGTKKDFVDIVELLDHITLEELLEYYADKYPQSSTFMALTSLSYFTDAEREADPKFLKNQTWQSVKEEIQATLRGYE